MHDVWIEQAVHNIDTVLYIRFAGYTCHIYVGYTMGMHPQASF